jgi:hypothetical protein
MQDRWHSRGFLVRRPAQVPDARPSVPARLRATCRLTRPVASGPSRSRSAVRRRCGSAGSSRNLPIRSARSRSGSMTTWSSSARGAGPSASRRARSRRSSSSGRTFSKASGIPGRRLIGGPAHPVTSQPRNPAKAMLTPTTSRIGAARRASFSILEPPHAGPLVSSRVCRLGPRRPPEAASRFPSRVSRPR